MKRKHWARRSAAVALVAALMAGGPTAAQLPDLGGIADDLVKDAVKDKAVEAIRDAVGDYIGDDKEPARPPAPAATPAPKRAPAVQKALVSAEDPEAVRETLEEWGSATLSTTKDGDPRISGRIDDAIYTARFFGCRRGASCEQIVFSAGFAETGATLETINAWNRTKLFGRALLTDGGDAVIEMPVNLRFGVSRENLEDTVDLWRVTVLDFRDFVRGASAQ